MAIISLCRPPEHLFFHLNKSIGVFPKRFGLPLELLPGVTHQLELVFLEKYPRVLLDNVFLMF